MIRPSTMIELHSEIMREFHKCKKNIVRDQIVMFNDRVDQ